MPEVNYPAAWAVRDAAPFFMCLREGGFPPTYRHDTLEAAEDEAARIAARAVGNTVHVLAVVSTVTSSASLAGARFDPTKAKPITTKPDPVEPMPDEAPEFAEVEEAAPIAPPSFAIPDDDQPF